MTQELKELAHEAFMTYHTNGMQDIAQWAMDNERIILKALAKLAGQ